MEFWQQLVLTALGSSIVTSIVVSLLNNWFESRRDDTRWKREKEERREQWGIEKEERQEQRAWMLREDVRQQRREWRRERLQLALKFLDKLAVADLSMKIYSVAEEAIKNSEEVKAKFEDVRVKDGAERLRRQTFSEAVTIFGSIDDPELRQLVLDLSVDLLREVPLDIGKIDAARAKIEQLVIEVS